MNHAVLVYGSLAAAIVFEVIGTTFLQMADDGIPEDDGEDDGDDPGEAPKTSYATELFMMAVGALFLSLNLAPTEEMILLAHKMTAWHALALLTLSIFLMHGFVYALAFRGSHSLEEGTPGWHAFIRFTPEIALEQARAAEARQMSGALRGPLDGIPVAHKDIYETAGVTTTCGTRAPACPAAACGAWSRCRASPIPSTAWAPRSW